MIPVATPAQVRGQGLYGGFSRPEGTRRLLPIQRKAAAKRERGGTEIRPYRERPIGS